MEGVRKREKMANKQPKDVDEPMTKGGALGRRETGSRPRPIYIDPIQHIVDIGTAKAEFIRGLGYARDVGMDSGHSQRIVDELQKQTLRGWPTLRSEIADAKASAALEAFLSGFKQTPAGKTAVGKLPSIRSDVMIKYFELLKTNLNELSPSCGLYPVKQDVDSGAHNVYLAP